MDTVLGDAFFVGLGGVVESSSTGACCEGSEAVCITLWVSAERFELESFLPLLAEYLAPYDEACFGFRIVATRG